jgi:hypothetical protein
MLQCCGVPHVISSAISRQSYQVKGSGRQMHREAFLVFGLFNDFFNAHLLFIMQFIVAYNTLVKVYLLDEEYDGGSGQDKDHRLALPNSDGTVPFYREL